MGDDTQLLVLLRDAMDAEQLENLDKRSRFRWTTDAGKPAPGSASSYAWLYTGLDGFTAYNVFHWSLGHENAVIDDHLATYRDTFVGEAIGYLRNQWTALRRYLSDGNIPIDNDQSERTIRSLIVGRGCF